MARLIAALKDTDGLVRQAAAGALGQIGDARAVEPLIAALTDMKGSVRQDAAKALGQIRDARVVEPLTPPSSTGTRPPPRRGGRSVMRGRWSRLSPPWRTGITTFARPLPMGW